MYFRPSYLGLPNLGEGDQVSTINSLSDKVTQIDRELNLAKDNLKDVKVELKDVKDELNYVNLELKDVKDQFKDVNSVLKDVRNEVNDLKSENTLLRSDLVGAKEVLKRVVASESASAKEAPEGAERGGRVKRQAKDKVSKFQGKTHKNKYFVVESLGSGYPPPLRP